MHAQLTLLPPTKRCTGCGEIKSIEDFYRAVNGCRHGRKPRCKRCSNADARAWERADRAANPEKHRAANRRKDSDPERKRQRNERARWRRKNDAEYAERKRAQGRARTRPPRTPTEIERGRETALAWYYSNYERATANNRRQVRERRARMLEAFVEHIDDLVVLERYDGVCGICGEDVDPLAFEVDHIIPLSRGGGHSYANVQPAHRSCNRSKHARLPEEYAA